MSKMIFVSLPVTDLKVSMAFYESIGFKNDPRFTDETAACMAWSETITSCYSPMPNGAVLRAVPFHQKPRAK
jgi:predicted lactoylglutathione lyase